MDPLDPLGLLDSSYPLGSAESVAFVRYVGYVDPLGPFDTLHVSDPFCLAAVGLDFS